MSDNVQHEYGTGCYIKIGHVGKFLRNFECIFFLSFSYFVFCFRGKLHEFQGVKKCNGVAVPDEVSKRKELRGKKMGRVGNI